MYILCQYKQVNGLMVSYGKKRKKRIIIRFVFFVNTNRLVINTNKKNPTIIYCNLF